MLRRRLMTKDGQMRLSEVLEGAQLDEQLIELIPGLVYLYDLVEHRNIFASQSLAEFLGYAPSEVSELGDRLLTTTMHPDDLVRAQAHHARMLELPPKQLAEFEYRIRDAAGEWRWLHSWEVLLPEAAGPPRKLLGLAHDVTQRVLADQALQESRRKHAESEQRWRSIAENPHDHVVVIDRNLKYTYINFAAPGLQPEELIGKHGPFDFVSQRDQAAMREAFEYTFEHGKPSNYEVYVEQLDKWYHNLVGPIREGETVTHLSVLTRDISAEKRAQARARESELQMRRMEAKLAQSAKLEAVGQLASGIAHDFNNLLTSISGVVELMADELAGKESLREVIELGDAVKRGAALTKQLLAFSRQQAASPVVLDVNELIENSSATLQPLITAKIELVLAPAERALCVRADPHQLEQVLVNIAVNARDAMPEGGRLTLSFAHASLRVGSRLEHPDARPGEYVCISVSDTGTGMDEATIGRVFEPFFTTKPPGTGTGLGLAIVHGIVKKSGGFVLVRSKPLQGSTFEVWLPLAEPPLSAAQGKPDARPTGSETVLLVEDEEQVLHYTAQLLERLGYSVITAARADEALQFLRAGEPFDLLLTDVRLPGMDGRDFFRRVNAIRGPVPVVFMSGFADNILAEQGLVDAGAVFLPKPFSWHELALKVRTALDVPRSAPSMRVLD
jgi:PAS domain S-box-containing protein